MSQIRLGTGKTTVQDSEPGLLLVLQISGAKFFFKDLRLSPAANDLQRDKKEQEEQEPGPIEPDDEPGDKQRSKDIDRIANAGVESRRYEFGSLGADAEGASQLKAGNNEQQKCRCREGKADDACGSPREISRVKAEDHYKDEDDGKRDKVEFH